MEFFWGKNYLVGALCATEITGYTRELSVSMLELLAPLIHSADPVDEAKVLEFFQADYGLPTLHYYKEIHKFLFAAERYRQPEFSQMSHDSTYAAVKSCCSGLRPMVKFYFPKHCAWE